MQDRVLWFCGCGATKKERERGRAKQRAIVLRRYGEEAPFFHGPPVGGSTLLKSKRVARLNTEFTEERRGLRGTEQNRVHPHVNRVHESSRLRDEGTADAGATACDRLRVGLVQDDAHGRKNRDVQDCVELGGKIVGFFQQERHTAIA